MRIASPARSRPLRNTAAQEFHHGMAAQILTVRSVPTVDDIRRYVDLRAHRAKYHGV
ncbi:unannotated protein [freshwater metagenome]|uniref:Unannotated protein n=1 Tax=freshwater metagenome TaxID=449393 RepID=A0A6J7ENF1_9ZZZZ